jgi:hypothetical protein
MCRGARDPHNALGYAVRKTASKRKGGTVGVAPKARYVVDDRGEASAVLIDIEEYRRLLEDLEELESIRAYDEAVASGDEAVPFEQAVREIEQRER